MLGRKYWLKGYLDNYFKTLVYPRPGYVEKLIFLFQHNKPMIIKINLPRYFVAILLTFFCILVVPHVALAYDASINNNAISAVVKTNKLDNTHNVKNYILISNKAKNLNNNVATFEKINNTFQTTYLISANSENDYRNEIYTGSLYTTPVFASSPDDLSYVIYQKDGSWPPALPDNRNFPSSTSASSPIASGLGGSGTPLGGFLPGSQSSILNISTSLHHSNGNNWFFIAFIGNILMMLLGRYLRLHSGRSPGFFFSIV